jgi:PTS system nitrogen regulatory IIA component
LRLLRLPFIPGGLTSGRQVYTKSKDVHSDGIMDGCLEKVQLTVRNVAELLNVSEKSVYRWITEGSLPGYRVSGQYRFNRAEVLEWATAQKINVSPKIFDDFQSNGTPLPDLADAMQAGGIFYRLGGIDKESVLKEIVDTMRLPEEVDRQFLLQVLLAREALESTAIGDGIAIPHVRNPIVLHVAKPLVTLGFLETPVDFGALDGKPVHALFSVISPTVRAHLHLLSQIAFTLRDPDFKAIILCQGNRDEILAGVRRIVSGLKRPVVSEAKETP